MPEFKFFKPQRIGARVKTVKASTPQSMFTELQYLLNIHLGFCSAGTVLDLPTGILGSVGKVQPGSDLSVGLRLVGWAHIEQVKVHRLKARPNHLHLVNGDHVMVLLTASLVVPLADRLQVLQAELQGVLVDGPDLGRHGINVVSRPEVRYPGVNLAQVCWEVEPELVEKKNKGFGLKTKILYSVLL